MADPVSLGSDLLTFAAGLLAGALSPTYYATERLRGLGRALLGRMPYQPPPGQSPDEAMREAVDADETTDTALAEPTQPQESNDG